MTADDKRYTKEEVDLQLMARDIKRIREDMFDIKNKLNEEYVTTKEFGVVRSIVFGMVGIILVGFLGAVVTVVMG